MAVKTNIVDVIPQIVAAVDGTNGISFAPDNPPGSVSVSPFGIVYLESGRAEMAPPGSVTYRDNVVIQVGVPLNDMPRNDETILPIGRRVLDALFTGLKNATIEPLNFDGTEYNYGPFVWGGQDQFGWTIRMLNVKTQETL